MPQAPRSPRVVAWRDTLREPLEGDVGAHGALDAHASAISRFTRLTEHRVALECGLAAVGGTAVVATRRS